MGGMEDNRVHIFTQYIYLQAKAITLGPTNDTATSRRSISNIAD